MTAFINRAPAGVVGEISRTAHKLVENYVLDSAKTHKFGQVCKVVAGKVQPIEAGDAATAIKGLLSRSAPQVGTLADDAAFNAGTPDLKRVHGVMREGYMHVACAIGTPVKGAPVYVRVTAASGKLVGDIEATADGANNVAIPGCEFAVSGKDAANVTEIAIY